MKCNIARNLYIVLLTKIKKYIYVWSQGFGVMELWAVPASFPCQGHYSSFSESMIVGQHISGLFFLFKQYCGDNS